METFVYVTLRPVIRKEQLRVLAANLSIAQVMLICRLLNPDTRTATANRPAADFFGLAQTAIGAVHEAIDWYDGPVQTAAVVRRHLHGTPFPYLIINTEKDKKSSQFVAVLNGVEPIRDLLLQWADEDWNGGRGQTHTKADPRPLLKMPLVTTKKRKKNGR